MIKKRETSKQSLDIDTFINGSSSEEKYLEIKDPKAPRKYKNHTLPMNEYEYDLLKSLAEKYGQTHSGIIRYALKALNEK
ncbi:hypothetical protein [Acinetobacter pollinis]|jgi:hypothetical protein|uniref:hypothetical protein n=1 Tax=Acinetobacter pollinis TaxID=2605270 RepID=UPI0018A3369D|nr:hypothetical protein [Acinetobacter pollinis]MBF7691376.1 hypothetical protein [Acinetobacter pollinis]MBF7693805.1 hypothetical protein [Acinetobacter pollinis]MBF7698434.1 hypothetical protein [Acinetobacter pollinis]MBF7701395.1 hypothetical protein [Acinetobacter pollinis]